MKYNLVLIFVLLVFFSSCSEKKESNSTPLSHFKGNIKGISPQDWDGIITVPNVVAGNPVSYFISLDSGGAFCIDIPVTCPVYAGLTSKHYKGAIMLTPGDTAILNIDIKGNKLALCNITDNIEILAQERTNMMTDMREIIDKSMEVLPDTKEIKNPVQYSHCVLNWLNKFISDLNYEYDWSEQAAQIMKTELKMFYLDVIFLSSNRFQDLIKNSASSHPDSIRYYYQFLTDFDLTNKDNLSTTYYSIILQKILQDPILKIPSVTDSGLSAEKWIQEVRNSSILGTLIGTNEYLFYDILLANSYSTQLNKMTQFTSKQIQDIESFYGENVIGKSLLLMNEKVKAIIINGVQKKDNLQKNLASKTTDTGKEYMNEILTKYQGKVVVIDFWATWCHPCLKSIQANKTLKNQFKDVIFVYITSESSPPTTWGTMKEDIKGVHYYVKNDVWEEITELYDFSMIPTLLIFNKTGTLEHKEVGFKENNLKIKEIIEQLL